MTGSSTSAGEGPRRGYDPATLVGILCVPAPPPKLNPATPVGYLPPPALPVSGHRRCGLTRWETPEAAWCSRRRSTGFTCAQGLAGWVGQVHARCLATDGFLTEGVGVGPRRKKGLEEDVGEPAQELELSRSACMGGKRLDITIEAILRMTFPAGSRRLHS
jgi:hypothetical protein